MIRHHELRLLDFLGARQALEPFLPNSVHVKRWAPRRSPMSGRHPFFGVPREIFVTREACPIARSDIARCPLRRQIAEYVKDLGEN